MTPMFTLSIRDFLKGAIVAVIMAILVYVEQVLKGGSFDYHTLILTAFGAFIAYLVKNFASDEQGKFLGTV